MSAVTGDVRGAAAGPRPARWAWFERKFAFDYPPEKFPELLERWRGTPARLEERVRGLTPEAFRWRDGPGWSIQENIGHLVDLEYLATTRLAQSLAGERVLLAADLTNARTNSANHNARRAADLLAEFRQTRMASIAQFESVRPEDWGRGGLHPRLQTQMRIVDILHFMCEHDDYHMARIAELMNLQGLR